MLDYSVEEALRAARYFFVEAHALVSRLNNILDRGALVIDKESDKRIRVTLVQRREA